MQKKGKVICMQERRGDGFGSKRDEGIFRVPRPSGIYILMMAIHLFLSPNDAHGVRKSETNNSNLIRVIQTKQLLSIGCSGISGGGGPVVGVSPLSNHRLTRTRGSNQGGSARRAPKGGHLDS
jgi:hypothetical protein